MVVLGRIVAPFGVHGWVKVHPFGDEPEHWRHMPQWWLGADADGQAWQKYQLQSIKPHGKGLLVRFSGIDDRGSAEGLEGLYIAAPRQSLPATRPDEYYWGDLIGLRIENLQGDRLGRVVKLLETGADAVLVIGEGEDEGKKGRERLLPFVANVIKEVDLESGCIRVDWGKDW